MLIGEIKPSPFLADFIRLYRIVDFQFPAGTVLPTKAYPPRPEHCLQFYPKDTEKVTYSNNVSTADKRTTLIGQHTTLNTRHVGKDFLSFQVVFKPGALFRLTGIPAAQFTNVYMDAEAILGTGTRLVNEQLYRAKTYQQMITIVELYLKALVQKIKKQAHPVDLIGMQMIQEECYSLDTFIKEACLSHRQFDRKFLEHVGISPKQYLQVIRFDRAFRMKNRYPGKDWLTVALHCGYYDYQHLVRDYKEFTSCTPNQFMEIENKAPERFFGDVES